MCLKFYQCLTYFVVILLLSTHSQNPLEEGLRKYGIIPNVILKAPKEVCKIKYYWGDLKMGAELDKVSVYIKPYVEWNASESDFYTVYLVAYLKENYTPSRLNSSREWCQWILVDVPGIDVTQGRNLYDYVGSWGNVQPNTTDVFTFLVYKQPKGKDTYKQKAMGQLFGKNYTYLGPLSRFVSNYSLGEPVCANYYLMNE